MCVLPETVRIMTDKNESNLNENVPDSSQSRRGFLTKSAVAGGALLALGGGAGVALADEHTVDATEASFDDVDGTDVDVLNYALTLEHLESAFYEEALETFDADDFVEADSLQEYTEADREALYGYVEMLADHEAQHVNVLTQAIQLVGGDPVVADEYDFGYDDVEGFLSLGAVLENTGVGAYAGAAPFVESPDLLGAALSIHSVEARHAALLNKVTGTSPFPNAFDQASSQSEVLDAVSQFIVGESETETDDDETETESGETETETESGETETETESGETETETGTETETEAGNETVTGTENGTATDTGNATATETGTGTSTGTEPSGT
jgi:hypothetical protein